ncbi:MAG: hypothetical protein LUG18_13680 [Candidatus Azobacteroides sp.]|nr:hypothetical protein [Candidatus Azobacteroides sp.]
MKENDPDRGLQTMTNYPMSSSISIDSFNGKTEVFKNNSCFFFLCL